jgi:serine-type D-Ala-D-Ala carboxypeptidase/endopeptidase (penicillin-binding protein 4)
MLTTFALALALPPALFDVPTLRGAQVGIYAVDAQTGAEIYADNPDTLMLPASNFKLIVGSASLDLLGPAFTFTTTLSTDGSALYLRSDGDPLLKPDDFADAAHALSAAGETHFTALDGDDSAIDNVMRYPGGWSDDDPPYDYAAPPSALSFDENVVQVEVTPGRAACDPALVSVTPSQNAVTVLGGAVTGAPHSGDTIEATIAWEAPNTLRVIGSIPADARPDDFGVSVLDAPQFALSMLAQSLTEGGIAIGGTGFATSPADARVLWTHHSEPLTGLLRSMWWPSDNLLAESLLDALGGSRPAGLARERSWLASIGIDPSGLTMADGSGLSAYDRISPRDLVAILAHDWNGPNRATVLAALPVAGKSGTLEHAFLGTPLVGKVVAKTGTVNHTRTLSGYLQTPHGTIIFSLLVNDWLDPSPQAGEHLRAFQASVLEALANG